MLVELNVSDFAIIEKLYLSTHTGFNVLTGETGAGKSIIIDAISMLLGGRADTSFIRAGSKRARIEGIFRLSSRLREIIDPMLEEEGLEGDNPGILILGRELRDTGRSICRVNGQAVTLSIMGRIAAPLVDIHGQSEHLSLMQVKRHQYFLDRFAGLEADRAALAEQVRRLQKVRKELTELRRDEKQLARRMDELAFHVEEIEAANLKVGEEDDLNTERTRLANAEQISQLAGEAYSLILEGDSGDQQPSALDLLGQASKALSNLARLDVSMEEQAQLLDSLTYQLEDLASNLRDYTDDLDFNPNRLEEVEERLALIFNLKRKYGDSIEKILAYCEEASEELENITHSEERMEKLQAEAEKLRHTIGEMALAISKRRQAAGETLSQGVVTQLADLGMPKASFAADVQWEDDPDGVYVETEDGTRTVAFDNTGIDKIEFLIAPNPGEPLKPLVKVASGGETSRVMLALKTVLAKVDETPTLIFDEVDQGVGGRVGGVVGRKLWELAHASGHQVLCITHLPQIAGYGDVHYHVAKRIEGNRTITELRRVEGDEQVTEIAQMLGVLSDSTRQSARDLIEEAEAVKEKADTTPEGVAVS